MWGGYRQCHCAGCHRTFSGLSTFDAHRLAGGCLDPALSVAGGQVQDEFGVWGIPGKGKPAAGMPVAAPTTVPTRASGAPSVSDCVGGPRASVQASLWDEP